MRFLYIKRWVLSVFGLALITISGLKDKKLYIDATKGASQRFPPLDLQKQIVKAPSF